MAGAGGTGPQQQPNQLDDLREQLVQAITQQLHGGEPTPPQYQPAQVSPQQGFAMARNPQLAGMLNQNIQAPAQAQYAQQQAAFEQAMSGRQNAIGAGVSLLGSQARSNRPMIKEYIEVIDGKRMRIRDTLDASGNTVRQEVLGEAPESMAMLASPEGYFPTSRQTGQAKGPVQSPGGGTVYPPPPAGVVSSVAASTATLGGLDDIWRAYQEIHEKTAGEGGYLDIARQRVGTFVGETRLGGALAPEYAKYTSSRRASLNAYIKGQTGAQFSVKELERYDTQYPEPWDPPEIARSKIDELRQRALNDMQAKLRVFPGAAGAAPQGAAPQSESIVDKALRLAEERRNQGGQRANP